MKQFDSLQRALLIDMLSDLLDPDMACDSACPERAGDVDLTCSPLVVQLVREPPELVLLGHARLLEGALVQRSEHDRIDTALLHHLERPLELVYAACAAALEVQRIVQGDNLLENVRCMGAYLELLLHQRLDAHPHVGHIRGRGLFWGIEFVANKVTKVPFDSSLRVADKIHRKGMSKGYDVAMFQATGSAEGGWSGDHILLAPPYTVSRADVEEIVDRTCRAIEDVFKRLQ